MLKILAIGDIVGEIGLRAVERTLRTLRSEYEIDFTVANGENASGVGITPSQANRLYTAGVDVITLGNHVWGRREIAQFLDDDGYILRPANLADLAPGRGYGIFLVKNKLLGVVNLIGRCEMHFGPDNPFHAASKIVKEIAKQTNLCVVDFHANATSEKAALCYHLDGKVSAVWGTHTHVQTADERIFPQGTGFLTDLGMTGPVDSVLGVRAEQSVRMFRGEVPSRFETADGDCAICGAVFTIDETSGKCIDVERIRREV